MQHTDGCTASEHLVGPNGIRQGLLRQVRDDGVDPGVEPLDLPQVCFHDLARREGALADEIGELGRRHEAEFVRRHYDPPLP
ncbi:hypothetical protein D3C83_149000 [compost metagenome]